MRDEKIMLRIITHPLPETIHGCSAKDGGGYIVLINENDDPDRQQETFIHEMLHIWHRDHDRQGASVQDIETERQRAPAPAARDQLDH